MTNKTYKEGQLYNTNGYTININHSYYTDKDYLGNVISEKSNFVIVDLSIVNNSSPRKIKTENFHLKNGDRDYVTTGQVFAKEFQDLGNAYDSVKELRTNEKLDIIIIFKVKKDLKKNNFSLFYQENDGTLRKIKLKIDDVSKEKDMGEIEWGKDFKFNLKNKEHTIIFDDYEFTNEIDYTYLKRGSDSYEMAYNSYNAPSGYSLMILTFASDGLETKEMVDFSVDYGKIVYIDNNNMEQYVNFKYPLNEIAKGKQIIALVPNEVIDSKKIKVVYTVRDEIYTLKIK